MLRLFKNLQKSLFKKELKITQVKYFFNKNKPKPEQEQEQKEQKEEQKEEQEQKENTDKDRENNEKKDEEKKDEEKNKKDTFGFFKLSKGTPMIKEEAYKIFNLTENDEITSELIMERYEKYFITNDPNKGGSYYLQNKIFYAKEFLMKDFPKSENKSKYDLDNPVTLEQEKEKVKDEKI